jgi:hypothetical protein
MGHAQVPCNLRFVDTQMGANGTMLSLRGDNGCGFRGRQVLGGQRTELGQNCRARDSKQGRSGHCTLVHTPEAMGTHH